MLAAHSDDEVGGDDSDSNNDEDGEEPYYEGEESYESRFAPLFNSVYSLLNNGRTHTVRPSRGSGVNKRGGGKADQR